MASEYDATVAVDSVVLDALVVMKIIKHARENPRETVQGPLLGLASDDSLEVTNCFPLPQVDSAEDGAAVGKYQLSMMKRLRDVNADYMQIGWYQVSELGSFFDSDVTSVQFEHQSATQESIVLVYDPLSTTQGSLSVKAFRLTEEAMKMFSQSSYSSADFKKSGLSHRSVFEEIPVVMRMSPLARTLVLNLTENVKQEQVFDRLDLSTNVFMEKNIHLLMRCIDQLADETSTYAGYQKDIAKYRSAVEASRERNERATGNKDAKPDPSIKMPVPPSRLESLLINAQINNYCRQISQFSGQSFGKLYLAKGIQTAAST